MIRHYRCAQHRRRRRRHQQRQQQKDHCRRCTAERAGLCLSRILLARVLHVVDRRRLVVAKIAAALLPHRRQVLLVVGVVQAEDLIEVILVRGLPLEATLLEQLLGFGGRGLWIRVVKIGYQHLDIWILLKFIIV